MVWRQIKFVEQNNMVIESPIKSSHLFASDHPMKHAHVSSESALMIQRD